MIEYLRRYESTFIRRYNNATYGSTEVLSRIDTPVLPYLFPRSTTTEVRILSEVRKYFRKYFRIYTFEGLSKVPSYYEGSSCTLYT